MLDSHPASGSTFPAVDNSGSPRSDTMPWSQGYPPTALWKLSGNAAFDPRR